MMMTIMIAITAKMTKIGTKIGTKFVPVELSSTMFEPLFVEVLPTAGPVVLVLTRPVVPVVY